MLEAVGDIWECRDRAVIAITTNGAVTKNGRAVFGRGVAGQAAARFPLLAEILGRKLLDQGNHVFDLGGGIVSFPVEETPWSLPDLRIIACSAHELLELTVRSGWQRVVLPRPGCGGGGLAWKDVQPLLEPVLDDRFVIFSQ
jgi:hypothetical protein